MSDGGDGFGEIVGRLLGAREQKTWTVNAAHGPVEVAWWWAEESSTAVVESARAIGLAMLPKGKFHPFDLDTLGLGQLLLSILERLPDAKFIVGIGGSATNDGGFGMARGVGYRFFGGEELTHWTDLDQLKHIESPGLEIESLTIATDVQNPLLGPQGASRIYGPQKGLRSEDFARAEACLQQLAEIAHHDLGVDAQNEPGTGAAGGLGYGLRVFLEGRFEAGFDIFARLSRLAERIRGVDLVITGEGSIDQSTFMGKGTGAVARLAKEQGRNCIGLAGVASGVGDLFAGIHPIHPMFSLDEALSEPKECLRKLAKHVAKDAVDSLVTKA
jgi:glycerate 2-kinase